MEDHHVKAPLADHSHIFLGAGHAQNERRTWAAISLTLVMMVAEIAGGTLLDRSPWSPTAFIWQPRVGALDRGLGLYVCADGMPTISVLSSAPESSAISPDLRAPLSLR